MPLIELRRVSKAFDRHVVLDQVSLAVEAGQSLVVIGASGSGKSVLLKHMVRLLRPDSGEVYFNGARIDAMSELELTPIRAHFGYLFQGGALFDSMTAGENIAFPIRQHTNKSDSEIKNIVAAKLRLVGLDGLQQRMPAELSGGQLKRVALARAIAMNPQVILYDEPTTGLDPIRADVINQLILKLHSELKVTSVTVTHDMQSAYKIAQRIVMIHNAKIVIDGTPEQIQQCTEPVVHQFITGHAPANCDSVGDENVRA